ncbi:hypothetical protein JCM10207_007435 [Rhodosporidiobolus poonsookiae]
MPPRLLPLLTLAAAVHAHMSPWLPSMYGNWALYPELNPVDPLGPGWSYDEWWFRGPATRAAVPEDGEVAELPAGGTFSMEIACGAYYTTMFGSDPNGNVACDDPGPYHADPVALEVKHEWLAGCALGIADVMHPDDANPDNFVVFSVQKECVWTRNTTFAVPARMPACTGEWCICGWLWQPQTGTGNSYHTGFRCKVTGSPPDATPIAPPVDPAWCEFEPDECTKGAKKMLIVFNEPTNIYMEFPSDNRPRYDETWRWATSPFRGLFFDGPQDDIFLPAVVTTTSTTASTSSTASPATSTQPPSSASALPPSTTTQGLPSTSSSSSSSSTLASSSTTTTQPPPTTTSIRTRPSWSDRTSSTSSPSSSLVWFPAPTRTTSASSSCSSSSSRTITTTTSSRAASTTLHWFPASTASATSSSSSPASPTTSAPLASDTPHRRLTFAERKALGLLDDVSDAVGGLVGGLLRKRRSVSEGEGEEGGAARRVEMKMRKRAEEEKGRLRRRKAAREL